MHAAGADLPDIAFRRARPPDALALGQAMVEASEGYARFAPADWEPFDAETQAALLDDLLVDEVYWCLLAEREGDLVGQVACLPASRAQLPEDDPGLAHLRQLFVRPDHWGTGLAATPARQDT